MGMRRDAEIAARQAAAGIRPPSAERARLLREMSNEAFALIKVIELEISGIRDGDGYWSGDVLGSLGEDLVALIEAHEKAMRREDGSDKPPSLSKGEGDVPPWAR
jgi:hypothetical protein